MIAILDYFYNNPKTQSFFELFSQILHSLSILLESGVACSLKDLARFIGFFNECMLGKVKSKRASKL